MKILLLLESKKTISAGNKDKPGSKEVDYLVQNILELIIYFPIVQKVHCRVQCYESLVDYL